MKKLFAILLALSMLVSAVAFAEEGTAPETPVLGEGEILMHGYVSPFIGYYVGVPANWALIGAGSNPDNISQAQEIIDDSVATIIKQMSAENDILFAVSEKGENLVLTYGEAAGATNEDLIKSVDAFKAELTANFPGIRFGEESGSYKLNDITTVLLIAATYNGQSIRQYYVASGMHMFVFTFTGVSSDIAHAVLSTFHM